MAATKAELMLLVVVIGSVAAGLNFWVRLPWYESLMTGLLAGVVVTATFHQRGEHFQTWREIRGILKRRA